MKSRKWVSQMICMAALATSITASRAEPVAHGCNTERITVSAEDQDDALLACEVAAAADTRFGNLGLKIAEPIHIEVTETLDAAPGNCVALYSTKTRKLQVLPVECLADRPGRASAFPEMGAKLLFESLIVHELVHAYVDQSAGNHLISRLAHEYLAYAIQIDSLPEDEQARIIAKAAIAEPVQPADINEATLNMYPLRFAAQAWLHFKQFGGDSALVSRIIKGDLVFDSLRE